MWPSSTKTEKKRCQAVNSRDQRCSNRPLPFSRYCVHHQDPAAVAGILIGILGIIASVACGVIPRMIQGDPLVSAEFKLADDKAPSSLRVVLRNTGRRTAEDVVISFEGASFAGVHLLGQAAERAEIIEQTTLANPLLPLENRSLVNAFAVRIPSLPANSTVSFEICTTHELNVKAASDLLAITPKIMDIIRRFRDSLVISHAANDSDFDLEALQGYLDRRATLFQPEYLIYEAGRQKVSLCSKRQRDAWSRLSQLTAKYAEQRATAVRTIPRIDAPIVVMRSPNGERRVPVFPPYINVQARTELSGDEVDHLRQAFKKGALFLDTSPSGEAQH